MTTSRDYKWLQLGTTLVCRSRLIDNTLLSAGVPAVGCSKRPLERMHSTLSQRVRYTTGDPYVLRP